MQESKVYTYEKMFKQMSEWNETVFKESNEDGWDKVKSSKGEYAFLIESTFNEYFNQRLPCKTMKIGENINNIGYGIVTSKGSNLSKVINLAVLELRESGELFKLEQKWWYDKAFYNLQDGRKRELSLSNVSGIFHILIGGLVLAMLIGVCEYLLHVKRKQRKKTIVLNTEG
ncbi:hypothetical protein KUTeg_024742 [Tegillarca granosa]|uniref:Ionotropic glutamate receptor C-terminal domain-containing protein n=1 Tax=Tegillarca granosa TaxID=220873 RepID=A0ABQ9E3B9_TEGGR|nr:hypothetical protein KUTeg_024742 [Tegillarca granosa]